MSAHPGGHQDGGISRKGGMTAAGQPGSSQPRGEFDVDGDRALEALRLAWGDAYDVGFERGEWVAISRADEHRVFTGDTPDALTLRIRADWAREGTL